MRAKLDANGACETKRERHEETRSLVCESGQIHPCQCLVFGSELANSVGQLLCLVLVCLVGSWRRASELCWPTALLANCCVLFGLVLFSADLSQKRAFVNAE